MDMLGSRLRDLRGERDLTQQQVADAVRIERSTLTNYEIGRSRPEHKILIALADYFQVSLDYLTGKTSAREVGPDDPDVELIKRGMQHLTPEERHDVLDYLAWKREQRKRVSERNAAAPEAPGSGRAEDRG